MQTVWDGSMHNGIEVYGSLEAAKEAVKKDEDGTEVEWKEDEYFKKEWKCKVWVLWMDGTENEWVTVMEKEV